MARGATQTILIVDDDPYVRTVFSAEFEDAGHIVWSTGDPAEALRLIETDMFDVVLLDHSMPGVKGVDLARRLRIAGYIKPVAIFTGHSDLVSLGGRADAFPLIDKIWPMPAILSAIADVAAGRPVETGRDARMSRLEALQTRRTAAANLDAAAKAAQATYADVAQEPLPASVASVLDRLKSKLAGG
ncbi:MAG TPA: response regulator [Beijerinckiaceae bacterium]